MDMESKPMMCFRPEIGCYVHVSYGGPSVIIVEHEDAYDVIPHDNEKFGLHPMQIWTVPKRSVSLLDPLDPGSYDIAECVREGRSRFNPLSGKIIIDGVEEIDSQRPPQYVLRFIRKCLLWAYNRTKTYRLAPLQIISTSKPLFTGTVSEFHRLRQSGEYTTTDSSINNLYNGLDAASSRLIEQEGQGKVGTSMESDVDVGNDEFNMTMTDDDVSMEDSNEDNEEEDEDVSMEDINEDNEEDEEDEDDEDDAGIKVSNLYSLSYFSHLVSLSLYL
jgi:hypothetical protein